MASEIEGCEFDVADGELFRGYVALGHAGARANGELTGVESWVVVSRVLRRGGRAVNVLGCSTATRSFLSMCRSVVFPALSRPRKRSFACLLARPREARRSKTTWTCQRRVSCGDMAVLMGYVEVENTYTCTDRQFPTTPQHKRDSPVDDPHVDMFWRGAVFKRVCTAAICNVNLSGVWRLNA